jgi:hypothetical protein
MPSPLKAAAYISSPDDQIWELLVPSSQIPQHPDQDNDDVDEMIENGED